MRWYLLRIKVYTSLNNSKCRTGLVTISFPICLLQELTENELRKKDPIKLNT
jgi:hypothetical protein